MNTSTTDRRTLGFLIDRDVPPEHVPDVAAAAEQEGFDEVWIVEDCFWAGGIASAATALAATSRVQVGYGIAPAPVRNPAILAMELAALARLNPGRLTVGIGHGVQEWMEQIGERVSSPLSLIEEVTTAVRRLLHGERVTVTGRHVNMDDVELVFPPDPPPPVLLGVRGPKSLALSGRIADGTILAEETTPKMLREALRNINHDGHSITVFAYADTSAHPPVAATCEGLFAAGARSVVLRPTRDIRDPGRVAQHLQLMPTSPGSHVVE
jgi:5,10-methylenetetrahydromethanopterin reductase